MTSHTTRICFHVVFSSFESFSMALAFECSSGIPGSTTAAARVFVCIAGLAVRRHHLSTNGQNRIMSLLNCCYRTTIALPSYICLSFTMPLGQSVFPRLSRSSPRQRSHVQQPHRNVLPHVGRHVSTRSPSGGVRRHELRAQGDIYSKDGSSGTGSSCGSSFN